MNRMRILVADDFGPEGLAVLEKAGDVTVKTGMDEDTLRETLPGYHALIVRSATRATARSLELAKDLVVIGRAGIGVDNIDVETATERGIVVMNTPEAGAVTTAELAIALVMALARNIPAADATMKAGKWEKKKLLGTELKGHVLGVFGLGRIGRVVAERGLGLQMQVIAHDPYINASNAPVGVRLVTFDELVAQSDFLTIHAPRTKNTENILDAAAIAKMKKGARIINAARGGIVNEDALCDALESGHLGGAALDVFTTEPLPEDHRLRHAPNLVLTPHLGASTREAKRSVSLDMANQIVLCLEKGVALNGLNVPRITRTQAQYVGPFLDLTRNLASFVAQVFPGKIRSLRLTMQGEIPGSAAHPLTAAMLVGALHSRAEGPVTPVNAERVAEQLGVRVHAETTSLKRDFVNVVRVEALVDDQRHFISGTVLGSRHGRMVELDEFLLDAIPEGPMLVTFHENVPGVVGRIGQVLADEKINISRLQLGATGADREMAMGIWNLDSAVSEAALERIRSEAKITRVCSVK